MAVFRYNGTVAQFRLFIEEGDWHPGTYFFFSELAASATAVVPEPATMTLLATGGLAMLRRRK